MQYNLCGKMRTSQRKIQLWLFSCCAMVMIMVIVGGLTRLTDSGLSIVEWKPVTGIIPPLNAEDWQGEFAKYQTSPEYREVNHRMTLDEFKHIYWFEFIHRLLGRITGLVFFLPFLWFCFTKQLDGRLIRRSMLLLFIGGLQGVIGWYMVKSGLIHVPEVSQYRLVLHLSTALLLYAILFWTGISLSAPKQAPTSQSHRRFSYIVTAIISLQILAGGFVAGLDAGFTYNTFPLMDGAFIPEGLLTLSPWYVNLFENITTVQFTHRILAYIVMFSVIAFWLKARNHIAHPAIHWLLVMTIVQVVLGISTLLMVVPISLASLHQVGAVVLLTISLFINHLFYATSKKSGV